MGMVWQASMGCLGGIVGVVEGGGQLALFTLLGTLTGINTLRTVFYQALVTVGRSLDMDARRVCCYGSPIVSSNHNKTRSLYVPCANWS